MENRRSTLISSDDGSIRPVMTVKNEATIPESVKTAAVEAIKSKAGALIEERQSIRDQMAELDQRLRRNEIALMDCRSAARLFGGDIELPEDLATARAVWVRRVLNDPPRPPAPATSPMPTTPAPARPTLPTEPNAFLSYRHHTAQPTLLGGLLGDGAPSIREIAIEQLKRAGNSGTRTSAIRQVVESILKKPTHEKTVGMTLYRLSKDGIARREGQTWFFVPAGGGTKNPGGSTPGSIEAQRSK
jgi:hypothetical protein